MLLLSGYLGCLSGFAGLDFHVASLLLCKFCLPLSSIPSLVVFRTALQQSLSSVRMLSR